jgi:hypothetical protein
MCARNEAAWLWGKEHVRAPVAVGDSPRDAWIRRNQDAWRGGAPRYYLDPTRSGPVNGRSDPGGDDDNGFPADPYARSVWAAQNAIRSGAPDNSDRVEAMQRRMNLSQPYATAASVAAERARYQPRDAATAQRIKDQAYFEMVERNQNAWKRP